MTTNSSPYDGAATGDPASETLYCANHPNVPTYLRCGRCEKPICARCRVPTPVGFRCVQCAQLTSLPTYAVSSDYYARALLWGFGYATVVGLIWALLPGFDFWAALALGFGVGETVSRAANLKRGPGLQAVGVAAGLWGILLSRVALAAMLTNATLFNLIVRIPGNNGSPILAGGISLVGQATRGDVGAVFLAMAQRTDVVGLIFLLLALGLIYVRLR